MKSSSPHVMDWVDSKGKVWPLIEVRAHTLSLAFQIAAHEWMSLLTDVSAVQPREAVVIFCESADLDLLFSDWINTLLFEVREKGMFFSKFEIEVSGINVKGKIYGEKIDPTRHRVLRDSIQGIAFNQLSTQESHEGVVVRGVLDDTERHFLDLSPYRTKS